MWFKKDLKLKKILINLRRNGIKAKASKFHPLWFTSDDFRILIKENNKYHGSIFCSSLNKKQIEWILQLQTNHLNWFKEHFREIEKAVSSNLLFYDYTRQDLAFKEIRLPDYLNNVLPKLDQIEITKHAENFAALFGGETISSNNNHLIGYTYNSWSFIWDDLDIANISFLIDKTNKTHTTFIIANPSQIKKTQINGWYMTQFAKAYLKYMKDAIIDDIKKLASNKGLEQTNNFASIINEKYTKWIFFLTSILAYFTSSLKANNGIQHKFITELDQEIRTLLGYNKTNVDDIIEEVTQKIMSLGNGDVTESLKLKDFNLISEKTWNEFIETLKLIANNSNAVKLK